MRKQVLACGVAALVLAGCAASGGQVGLVVLETPQYQRGERSVPRTFVQMQQAVFKQQASCGSTIQFAVDQNQPSYARISMRLSGATGEKTEQDWSHTLVLGVQMLEGRPARGRYYSYYPVTRAQMDVLYNAVVYPQVCPGQPIPADLLSPKGEETQD